MVTGGAGFIGSHLVDALVECGVDTISIDNYTSGDDANLERVYGCDNFEAIDCDIRDYDILDWYFEGVDIVFHNATVKKVACMNDPDVDLDVNARGTLNLLRLSQKHGVRKFVHASTGSVYGQPITRPQDETHPTVPTTLYGVSKLAGEGYVRVFHSLYGLDTTVLRHFHVYGPRQENDAGAGVVWIFMQRALEGKGPVIHGDGSQQRAFTYVGDVVAANLHVAVTEGTAGQVYNCSSGVSTTVGELADEVLEMTGRQDLAATYEDWRPGEVLEFDVDNGKLRDTGFEFRTSLRGGLAITQRYYAERL
jgi:nucleoside-diphosphate-sugar epimerase